jgi:hypothetical protein
MFIFVCFAFWSEKSTFRAWYYSMSIEVNYPFSQPIFLPFLGYCISRVWESRHHGIQLQYCSCLHNGKFTATTFKSRFSRCLNCLESFTRADSTPKWRISAFVIYYHCVSLCFTIFIVDSVEFSNFWLVFRVWKVFTAQFVAKK